RIADANAIDIVTNAARVGEALLHRPLGPFLRAVLCICGKRCDKSGAECEQKRFHECLPTPADRRAIIPPRMTIVERLRQEPRSDADRPPGFSPSSNGVETTARAPRGRLPLFKLSIFASIA